MTDRERYKALVAEIERQKDETSIGLSEHENGIENGRMEVILALQEKVKRMQEEPKECMYSKVNYTDEDRKALCDGCEEECKFKPTTSVWHDASEMPKFSERLKDGTPITPWIIGSNYGHISPNAAHTYTMEQWETHIGFEEHREFKWAYEDELIKL